MRLAMAQMCMSESIDDNLTKTLQFMKAANMNKTAMNPPMTGSKSMKRHLEGSE